MDSARIKRDGPMSNTVTLEGQEVDFDKALDQMDKDIRDELQLEQQVWDSNQEFMDAYATAHKVKHGQPFQVQ